ncbi:MAG TPA: GNAT family N-acetyltransferase [Candidatus Bathyarchaeia archaeon]|nr:GNAT family N-acetyltransferase [Candidatus Bathyarchaeia archaeon]
MSNLEFIIGKKEEIPSKYLLDLFELMQKNREEILKIKPPTLEFFKQNWIVALPEEEMKQYVIAVNDEKIVGYGYFSWNIKYDNLDRGYFWLFVLKEERRKHLGTKILQQLIRLCPPQVTIIGTEIFENSDGKEFIKTFKSKEKYIDVLSSSNITLFDPKEVQQEAEKLRLQALEKGYEIIFIDECEFVLHLDLPKYIQMVEEIWNDMPREELTYEDDVLTIERFLQMVQREQLYGAHKYTFVAIHKETNTPIGLTSSVVNKYHSDIAEQYDTGVLKEHRGKGLGLALKYQMLNKLLKDTEAKFWRTGNAGSNEYMLRINRLMKYEPYTRVFIYEFPKEDLEKMLK